MHAGPEELYEGLLKTRCKDARDPSRLAFRSRFTILSAHISPFKEGTKSWYLIRSLEEAQQQYPDETVLLAPAKWLVLDMEPGRTLSSAEQAVESMRAASLGSPMWQQPMVAREPRFTLMSSRTGGGFLIAELV